MYLSAVPAKTNVVVRRQYFSWQEVESSDFPTYVANLRQKLEAGGRPRLIRTVRGVGYILKEE